MVRIQDQKVLGELKKLNDEILVREFSALVKTERKITFQILLHIIEIERRKLHLRLGFDSMYSYLIRAHGYSGGSAQRRIQSAALLKDLPEIGESIEEGRVNLTQLNQVQLMVKKKEEIAQHKISRESKKEIVAAIESLTNFETELFLSKTLDMPVQDAEISRPQRDESLRLEITISKQVQEKLEEAKLLLSHVKHNPNWEQTLELLADFVIAKKSPARKVRKYLQKKKSAAVHSEILENSITKVKSATDNVSQNVSPDGIDGGIPVGQHVSAEKSHGNYLKVRGPQERSSITQVDAVAVRSRHIPAALRRQVLASAKGCQFVRDQGNCCGSRFQLQVDHIVPFALGGTTTLENLRALCRSHNLLEAERHGLVRTQDQEGA